VLLPLLTAPLAWPLVRAVARETAGPPLNRALAGTARLLLVYAVLFAFGLTVR
jgi:1,4-dihydroxy-2-naphthoate octaprenyltransferase